MSYRYEEYRAWLATDEGVKAVGEALRNVETKLDPAGAAGIMELCPSGCPTNWHQFAAVDHLVRLGMIEEIKQEREPSGQYRVFRRTVRGW